jgi:hypothetical protein
VLEIQKERGYYGLNFQQILINLLTSNLLLM